jgi:hypothetical protein
MRCSWRERLSLAAVEEAAKAVDATSAGAITQNAKNNRDRGTRKGLRVRSDEKGLNDRNNLLSPFFSWTANLDDTSSGVFD